MLTLNSTTAAHTALHNVLDADMALSLDHMDAHHSVAAQLPPDGGAYASHLPMAAHAFAALGGTAAQLQAWGLQAAAELPPQAPWPELEVAQAQAAQSMAAHGAAGALARALPALMPASGVMGFHALIRTAHAWESGHPGQLARALAYWTQRASSAPGDWPQPLPAPHLALDDWLAALLALPPALPGAPRDWISTRMAAWAQQPGVQAVAPGLETGPDTLSRLAAWAAQAYADSGNFTVLHLVTATRAAAQLLPLMAPEAQPAALRAFSIQVGLGLLASGWRGRCLPSLEAPPWAALQQAALRHGDAHVLKLAHAAAQLGGADPSPVWRQAVARALLGFSSTPPH